MPALLVAHLLLVGAYAGFQWTVRVVVYPQFALVPPDRFAPDELAHQRRIRRVVGPLFGRGERLADVVDNHVLSTDVPAVVAGRAVVCERLDMPIGSIGPTRARALTRLHEALSATGWSPCS